MTSSATDDESAAHWAIRLEGGSLDQREQAEFDAWIEADERRRGLVLRAEAVLAYLDRGRALAASPTESADSSPRKSGWGVRKERQTFGRRAFLIGGSASAMAAAGGFAYLWSRPPSVEIVTAIGEVRRVPLADGSVASVNTDSKVAVVMHEKRRQVNLENGEAWFQVAHDKKRPFVVETGDVRVQAIGTEFSVRKREDGAEVIVTEGIVEAWIVGHEDQRRRIASGSKAYVADAAPAIEVVKPTGDISRELAWRNGELVLNGESLEYAASELNRYNTRKLVIDDDTLRREQLVGYFRTDQPENFGRAVASMVGARVEVEGDIIRLSR